MSPDNGKSIAPTASKSAARPSLLDKPGSATASVAPDTQSIRMLRELEGPQRAGALRTPRPLLASVLLGFVVAAALVWWMSRPGARDDAAKDGLPVAADVGAASTVTDASRPGEPPASAAVAAAVAPEIAASAAGIEGLAEGAAPAAPVAAVAAAASGSGAQRGAKPKPSRSTATSRRDAAVAVHRPIVAREADRPRHAPAGPPKAVARREARDELGAPAAAIGRTPGTQDADVDLIAALLARVSSAPGAAGALASGDQLTIADIVNRCDARTGDAVAACKRRICEGYWGKAEACPLRLAPGRKRG